MYTEYIGRRLLDLYNEHRNKESALSPKQFFDDVFFPMVFDDERYLMLANNSKFDQAAKQKKKKPLTAEVRRGALAQFHQDVETLEQPHGHLYLGGSAREMDAATSSQITDITIPVSPDEIYHTWIGAAAGIGVKGGFSILMDNDQVLLALLDGWSQYRIFLNQLPTLKPYQIETWNGWWLIHRFSETYYQKDDPLRDFPAGQAQEPALNKGVHSFTTPPWIRVVFALSFVEATLAQVGYVYSFGQTNTTIGFIRFDLPKVEHLLYTYERLFKHTQRTRREFKKLYETQFGFMTACQQGSIGLKAIEPKNLRDYMPNRYNPGKIPKKPKKEADEINFQLYQTWIIAMLNNDDLLKQTQMIAEAFYRFSKEAKRGKQTHKTLINEVLGSQGLKSFIEAATEVIKEGSSEKQLFNELVESAVKMPKSDFPLFLTLLRFKYAYITE